MKNKAKFIPFLLVVPLLFMANSPAPGPHLDYSYTDFEVSNLTFGEPDEYDRYYFSLDIENKGNEYIWLDYFSFEDFYAGGLADKYKSSQTCIAPQSSGTYSSLEQVLGKFTLEETLEFSCTAFGVDGRAEYSKVEFVSKENNDKADFTYYNFKIIDFKTPSKEKYTGLFNVSIKGEKMAFHATPAGKDNSFSIVLYDSSLQAEDFVFDTIDLTEYHTHGIGLDGLFAIIGIFVLIGIGISMFGGFVFMCIFFSIRGVKKRKDDMPLPPPSLNV